MLVRGTLREGRACSLVLLLTIPPLVDDRWRNMGEDGGVCCKRLTTAALYQFAEASFCFCCCCLRKQYSKLVNTFLGQHESSIEHRKLQKLSLGRLSVSPPTHTRALPSRFEVSMVKRTGVMLGLLYWCLFFICLLYFSRKHHARIPWQTILNLCAICREKWTIFERVYLQYFQMESLRQNRLFFLLQPEEAWKYRAVSNMRRIDHLTEADLAARDDCTATLPTS